MLDGTDTPIYDLAAYKIAPYDYSHPDDDFLPLVQSLIDTPVWLLASPVYWYAVSAQMKTFIDRWTELLHGSAVLGRQLRGKHVALTVSSSASTLPDCVAAPVQLTAEYMGMQWAGAHHAAMAGPRLTAQQTLDARSFFAGLSTTG